MGRLVFRVVCSALVAVTIGCDSDSDSSVGGAGNGGAGGAAGMGGAPPFSVDFTIRSTEQAPIEGVEICEADTDNCATTDADGDTTIGFPAAMEVVYTVSKDGYVPELFADVTDFSFSSARSHTLFTTQEIADAAPDVGTVWPSEGTGWLSLGVNLAGVTFELVGETSEPWYLDEDGIGSTAIEATTTESLAGVRGGFVEVAPGLYEVEYGGTAAECVVVIGLPGTEANRIRVPVRAGHISYGSQSCSPM